MVKPLRLFWLIQMCFAFLGLGLLFPEEIHLGEGLKIKVPQLTATFWQKKPAYADISQIRKKFEPPTKKTRQKRPPRGFSRPKAARQYVPDSLRLNAKLRIQYPKNQDTLLNGFFRALKRLERGERDFVRVLHYGDSQLEGDRITAFLRDKFQNTFGGGGLGLLNLVDKLNTKAALAQSASPQWQPTVMYGPRYRRGTGSFFGVLGDFYRFALPDPPAWTKASLQYSLSQYASPTQRKINRLRVLYRNPEAPFELTVQLPDQPEIKEKLEENKRFGMYELPLSAPFERVSLGFASGQASPEVYAVSLDGVPGITFDNIPLRGSSGIEFSRAEASHFKQQFQELGVRFVILQFGVNIVPNPQASYDWYEDLFSNN
ncbi:MAG: hypothetical protein HC913_06665 [Microscillaceae bacterium]|nr:hypothetical protein [Microscillaceae bacterium]